MSRSVSEFRTSRRVEFADTDMGNLVHFSRFFVFMETAEHEFLASLGSTVHFELDGHTVGWPRLEARCQYLSPARYGDRLDIHLRVARKGTRSMAYDFTFRVGDRIVARGRIASICCRLDGPDGLEPIPIPASLADRIGEPEG
ncbi:MAG: thioesterase family protein [Thermoanaerobaculia bacterium]|nr:thioesterase family protein [Thermoanaerobaculia bacterium]